MTCNRNVEDTIKLIRLVFQFCYEFNSYKLIPNPDSVSGSNSKPIKKLKNKQQGIYNKQNLSIFFIADLLDLCLIKLTGSNSQH